MPTKIWSSQFYLAYLLTFLLAFYLAYLLTFFLAYLPGVSSDIFLAFYLAFIVTFYPSFYFPFHLASFQAVILGFYLASILTFYLAFCLAISVACVRVQSHSSLLSSRCVAGFSPTPQPPSSRCTGPLHSLPTSQLRSGSAHCDRSLRSGRAH